jgi:hypothetical protein
MPNPSSKRWDAARAESYRQCVCTGLAYLLKMQSVKDGTEKNDAVLASR